MKEVNVKVYQFSELNEKVQKVLIEKRRRQVIEDFDPDFCLLEWKEKLENFGFIDPKIYYSGFYQQGSGACFDCKDIDNQKILIEFRKSEAWKLLKEIKIFEYILNNSDDFELNFRIEETSYANLDSHERTRYIDNYFNYQLYLFENEFIEIKDDDLVWSHLYFGEKFTEKDFTDCVNYLSEFIESARLNFCKEIYKQLKKAYEADTSDQNCRELLLLEDEDNFFFKNGERYLG